jgi:hypothetical protein
MGAKDTNSNTTKEYLAQHMSAGSDTRTCGATAIDYRIEHMPCQGEKKQPHTLGGSEVSSEGGAAATRPTMLAFSDNSIVSRGTCVHVLDVSLDIARVPTISAGVRATETAANGTTNGT